MHIPIDPERPSPHSNVKELGNTPILLSSWHYIALLCIAIFGTYYYIIVHGDFIHLDDMDMVGRLLNQQAFSLKDLFLPKQVVAYYRPMIELSYQFDHLLWGDVASGWHLTNVVFHAANTGLVYLISYLLLETWGWIQNKEATAFYSALFYGMNPLATESVCWVSGRSDLVAAFFMLFSFALYLYSRNGKSYAVLGLSGLSYFIAAATKEVALTLPVILIVFEYLHKKNLSAQEWRRTLLAIGYFFLLTAVYFLLFRRAGVDTANLYISVGTNGLKRVSLYENILVLLASLGYYIRKLCLPLPLNFAIHSISLIFYGLVGLSVLILLMAKWQRLLPVIKFLIAWMLITVIPAIVIAALHITWVPWAERYLYIPLVGFSVALGSCFFLFKIRYKFVSVVIFALLTGLLWITTMQRVYVWANEERLWQDTAKKTDFGPVFYFYGKSLLLNDREQEGIEQLKKAISKGFSYYPYIALSSVAYKNGDFDVSEQWLKKALHDFPQNAEVHKYLASNYLWRTSETVDGKRYLMKAIDEYINYITMQQTDVSAYLTIAQLYKTSHQELRAVPFLEKIIKINASSPEARIALKFLHDIRKRRGTP